MDLKVVAKTALIGIGIYTGCRLTEVGVKKAYRAITKKDDKKAEVAAPAAPAATPAKAS